MDHPERNDGEPGAPRYVPVLDLVADRVVGAEVVTSWQGQAPAERRAQLRRSQAQLVEVAALDFCSGPAAAAGWWVSVAVGHRPFLRPGGADRLLAVLCDAGLAPERLLLAVREWDLAQLVQADVACELADLGLAFVLDDLGSGHLTAAQLGSVPIAHVRVDAADLVAGPEGGQGDAVDVCRAAGALGLRVLAHGAEHAGQLDAARCCGVELVQGLRWGGPGSLLEMAGWHRGAPGRSGLRLSG